MMISSWIRVRRLPPKRHALDNSETPSTARGFRLIERMMFDRDHGSELASMGTSLIQDMCRLLPGPDALEGNILFVYRSRARASAAAFGVKRGRSRRDARLREQPPRDRGRARHSDLRSAAVQQRP